MRLAEIPLEPIELIEERQESERLHTRLEALKHVAEQMAEIVEFEAGDSTSMYYREAREALAAYEAWKANEV